MVFRQDDFQCKSALHRNGQFAARHKKSTIANKAKHRARRLTQCGGNGCRYAESHRTGDWRKQSLRRRERNDTVGRRSERTCVNRYDRIGREIFANDVHDSFKHNTVVDVDESRLTDPAPFLAQSFHPGLPISRRSLRRIS